MGSGVHLLVFHNNNTRTKTVFSSRYYYYYCDVGFLTTLNRTTATHIHPLPLQPILRCVMYVKRKITENKTWSKFYGADFFFLILFLFLASRLHSNSSGKINYSESKLAQGVTHGSHGGAGWTRAVKLKN